MRVLVIAFLPWILGPYLLLGGPAEAPPESTTAAQARIDDVLMQLEKRGDGLKDIRCKVIFIEDDQINLSKRIKTGHILLLISEPNPRFLVHFDRSEVDGLLGKQEWYLFDGRWLYEALERLQQVTKREIVRPGEKIDLFDLEKTPFPLPFGQKKDKILRNFDVTLASSTAADPPDSDHLICIPKPGSRMEGKYDKLEFFVRRDVHLPGRIVVTRNDGLEINTAEFPDLSEGSINTSVKETAFKTPSAWKGYKQVVELLEPVHESPP